MKIKKLMKVSFLGGGGAYVCTQPQAFIKRTVKAGTLWTTSFQRGSFHGMKKGILVDDGGTDINLLYSLYYTLGMGICVSFSFQVLVVLMLS